MDISVGDYDEYWVGLTLYPTEDTGSPQEMHVTINSATGGNYEQNELTNTGPNFRQSDNWELGTTIVLDTRTE